MNISSIVNILDKSVFTFLSIIDFSQIYLISFFTYYFFYLFFLLFFIYLYFFERNNKIVKTLVILSLIGFCFVYGFKYFFKKERPVGIVEKLDYSFPSSHAYFATLVLIVSYLYVRNYFLKSFFIVLSLFLFFSILVLKIHYFSDVIFSTFLACLFFYIFNNKRDILQKIVEKVRRVSKKILEH
ncbi:MAG: phosphatase PAP2 family protein [Candidatus Aenigmatarchaeota archaeon]